MLVLSGDSPSAVAAVAGAAGISDARSRMLPEEKAAAVEALQQQGHRVAMVSSSSGTDSAFWGCVACCN